MAAASFHESTLKYGLSSTHSTEWSDKQINAVLRWYNRLYHNRLYHFIIQGERLHFLKGSLPEYFFVSGKTSSTCKRLGLNLDPCNAICREFLQGDV